MMSHCGSGGHGPVYIGGTGVNQIPINISAQPMPKPGEVYRVHHGGGGLLGAIIGAIAGGPLGFLVGAVAGNVIMPPSDGGFIKVGSNMEALPCDEKGKVFVHGGSTK